MNLSLSNKDFVIVKNFINESERNELNSWCYDNFQNDFFQDANMGVPGTRLTTRYSLGLDSFSFPGVAFSIRNKIIETFDIKSFAMPSYKDGIVCGIGFEGGDIFEHVDPVYYQDTVTVHFNILSQKSKSGGNTFINNKLAEVDERDLLCFKVSKDMHYVDTIVGDRERILWVFGFCIPEKDII